MGQPSPQPFRMHVADETLRDLRERLMRVRWPDEPPGAPWSTGSSVDYVRELVGYWRDGFDWRAQETALNRFQQFKVPLGGIDLHFIHEEGKGPNPMPLLLSHGWPGSIVEFHKILPMLTDPARFGGDPRFLHRRGAVVGRVHLVLCSGAKTVRRRGDQRAFGRADD